MNTLYFTTPGQLDPRSFTVFGLSVKSDESAIGYFGTGLKYAIAVLLRTGHQVEIRSGSDRYRFEARGDKFRDKEYQAVVYTLNDDTTVRDLPFTTELGKNWEVWMAFRELESNTRDEKGFTDLRPPAFTPDFSTIIVTGREICECYSSRSEYFLDTVPIFTNTYGDVHANTTDPSKPTPIFYKGVKVGQCATPSLFIYNIHSGIELTEDRTMRYDWQWKAQAARALSRCNLPLILTQLFDTRARNTVEHKHFDWTDAYTPCDEFLDALAHSYRNDVSSVSSSMLNKYRSTRGHGDLVVKYEPTTSELSRLNHVLNMLHSAGYAIPPMKLVSTTNETLMAYVDNKTGQIHLTQFGLRRGASDLAMTILEEHDHAVHKLNDFSRDYQDHLLRTIVNLIAEKTETVI